MTHNEVATIIQAFWVERFGSVNDSADFPDIVVIVGAPANGISAVANVDDDHALALMAQAMANKLSERLPAPPELPSCDHS